MNNLTENLNLLNASIDELCNLQDHILPKPMTYNERIHAFNVNPKLKDFYDIEKYKNLSIPDNPSELKKLKFGPHLQRLSNELQCINNTYDSFRNVAQKTITAGKAKDLDKTRIKKNVTYGVASKIYDFYIYPRTITKEDHSKLIRKFFYFTLPYIGFILFGLVIFLAAFLIHILTHQTGFNAAVPYIIAAVVGIPLGYLLRDFLEDLEFSVGYYLALILNFIFFSIRDYHYRKTVIDPIKAKYEKIKTDFLKKEKNNLYAFFIEMSEKIILAKKYADIIFESFALPTDPEEFDYCYNKISKQPSMTLAEAKYLYQDYKRAEYEAAKFLTEWETKMRAAKAEQARIAREQAEMKAFFKNISSLAQSEQEKNKKIEELNKELKDLNRKLDN